MKRSKKYKVMLIIPALRQKDCNFKLSLSNLALSYLETKNKKRMRYSSVQRALVEPKC